MRPAIEPTCLPFRKSRHPKHSVAYNLKWAFSEAAVLLLAKCPEGKKLVDRLAKKHGKGKALSILAHRIGRAAYFMLKRKRAFDLERFLRM